MNFKSWLITEVKKDIIDKALKDVENKEKPFQDIFGEKERIIIPYSPDQSIEQIVSIISKLRAVGELNLDTGLLKINNRDYRIGRFILQSQKDKTGNIILRKPSEETKPYFTNEEMKQVSFELLSENEAFIELIKEGQFKPGGHIIRFDSTKIKNGVYFYQLRTDNQIIKKKMVVDNLAV